MVSPVAAARAAKLAAKYGPYAVAAWKVGGDQAVAAAQTQMARARHRRLAADKARTVQDGSVLRVRDGEDVVWVVFAGDQPVESYPSVPTPLADLVGHADLERRHTPDELDQARLSRRAQRAARRTVRVARGIRMRRRAALPTTRED